MSRGIPALKTWDPMPSDRWREPAPSVDLSMLAVANRRFGELAGPRRGGRAPTLVRLKAKARIRAVYMVNELLTDQF